MEKINKHWLIVGVLALLVFLLSFISLIIRRSSTTSNTPNPTIGFARPTVTSSPQSSNTVNFPSFPTPTINPNYKYDYAGLQYPLEYENVVIDYTVGKNKMRVYYKNDDLSGARRSIKGFFAQYGFEDPMRSGVRITFVGLRTDAE